MHAITLWQPMAHAVVHLGKTTENRPGQIKLWQTLIGDTIAIHAARHSTWSEDYARLVHGVTGRRLRPDDVEFSGIIGTARVSDVHWAVGATFDDPEPCCDPWGFDGGVHLILENARPVPTVGCRGALGAWRVPDHVRRALEAVTVR